MRKKGTYRLWWCLTAWALLLPVCGCAPVNGSFQQPLEKLPPVVLIHPLDGIDREADVAVVNFQVPQNFRPGQGAAVARLFKDVLLGKRVFQRVVHLDADYADLGQAVQIGRQAGVDYVLAGRVGYGIEGTELGGARVAVAVRLLSVRSGDTLWYVEHGVDQPMDYPKMGMWTRFKESFNPPELRPSRGAPPLVNMLAKVAVDVGEVMAGARTVAR